MDNATPLLETYCADADCSPEQPCATCLTVPVRRETMAEVVYGAIPVEVIDDDPTGEPFDLRDCTGDGWARRTP